MKNLYDSLIEAVSMGVGGDSIADPGTDAGTGIPVKEPLRKKNDRKKPVPAAVLRLGAPCRGAEIGANPMIPGRSAFAKGIE